MALQGSNTSLHSLAYVGMTRFVHVFQYFTSICSQGQKQSYHQALSLGIVPLVPQGAF